MAGNEFYFLKESLSNQIDNGQTIQTAVQRLIDKNNKFLVLDDIKLMQITTLNWNHLLQLYSTEAFIVIRLK